MWLLDVEYEVAKYCVTHDIALFHTSSTFKSFSLQSLKILTLNESSSIFVKVRSSLPAFKNSGYVFGPFGINRLVFVVTICTFLPNDSTTTQGLGLSVSLN